MLVLAAFLLALIAAVVIAYPFLRRMGPSLLSDEDTRGAELASRWETAVAGLRGTELEWALGNLAEEDREWLRERYMTDAALVLKEMELEDADEHALMATVEREMQRARTQAVGEMIDETDQYEDWADRYDLFPEDRSEEEAFFRRLFSDNQVSKVLDCACGTGNELLTFSALGCEVVGSDISESMLAHAGRKIEDAGLDIPLQQLDYRHLPDEFAGTFDAVVCWSASIAHVDDDEDALRAFRSMRSALADGGILVLDQGLTDGRDNARFALNRSSRDATRLYVIDHTGERRATYHVLDVLHREPPELKVWTSDVHILLRDDQERLLTAAGFRQVSFYGGYGFEPYDKETSMRLIAVARR